jgi:hypothetical protein
MSLFDAAVDLNPHQIEAALFALQSPLSKGVILADEVGLGKNDRGGHRALPVLGRAQAPAARDLPGFAPQAMGAGAGGEVQPAGLVLDAKAYREASAPDAPLSPRRPSSSCRSTTPTRLRDELKAIAWDLVVIDEAHKLRNAYRPSNKVGQGIRWATEDCRKLLLTATPLQNSLLELYGLSTLIDEHLFGDVNSFRSQYASAGSSLDALRSGSRHVSASARCAIRSPSTSATPSGGPSRGPSRPPTTSTRSTRRSRPSCSARTATRSRSGSGT